MEQRRLAVQRQYWDRLFSQPVPSFVSADPQHWLAVASEDIAAPLQGNVLEVGSGQGYVTGYLVPRSSHLVCLDLSLQGLRRIAARYPTLDLLQAALPDPLPFRANSFDAVVAGLSLHYFRWDETLAIAAELRRVLRPQGLLLFQVNSTEDVHHGFGQGEQLEPRLFVVRDGRYKRFFSEEDCRSLFHQGWTLERLFPRVETRFDQPKPTWIGAARRQE